MQQVFCGAKQWLTGFKIPAASLFGVVILLALSGLIRLEADSPTKVGLVVRHADGDVVTQCVELSGDDNTGLDVLNAADLDFSIEVQGAGTVVCSIDNEGCNFPAESCFCQCQSEPCTYWSYWHMRNGAWEYSVRGASAYDVSHGDVEGWSWSTGAIGSGADSKPPKISFEEICIPPTNTPAAEPTAVPTLPPTNTPTPVKTPVIRAFSAVKTTIAAGESVTLSWDLSGADAAFLRYGSTEEGVVSPGSKTVSPTKTTVYTLVAKNDGGTSKTELTITVNPVTVTPLPTAAPTLIPPTATSPPAGDGNVQSQPLTDTPSPEPVVAEPAAPTATSSLPTDTPLPPTATLTPSPLPVLSLPTLTPTPQAVAVALPSPVSLDPSMEQTAPLAEPGSSGASRFVLFGALSGLVLILTTVPVLLLVAGGLWWLWKQR